MAGCGERGRGRAGRHLRAPVLGIWLLLSPGPGRHPDPFHHTSTGHGSSQAFGVLGGAQPNSLPSSSPHSNLAELGEKHLHACKRATLQKQEAERDGTRREGMEGGK